MHEPDAQKTRSSFHSALLAAPYIELIPVWPYPHLLSGLQPRSTAMMLMLSYHIIVVPFVHVGRLNNYLRFIFGINFTYSCWYLWTWECRLMTYIITINDQPGCNSDVVVRPNRNDELIGAICWYSVDTSGGVVMPSNVNHRVVKYNRIPWSHVISVKSCQEWCAWVICGGKCVALSKVYISCNLIKLYFCQREKINLPLLQVTPKYPSLHKQTKVSTLTSMQEPPFSHRELEQASIKLHLQKASSIKLHLQNFK